MTPEPLGASAARDAATAALSDVLMASAVNFSEVQRQQLASYVEVLSRWNAVHNLTAIRARDDILTHHVADCLAVIEPIRRHLGNIDLAGRRARILDVGSGGGLPGLIIAAMLPSVDVSCVDSVGKKVAFIQQAALSMALKNVTALHARVEALRVPTFDLITSRAFATLARFTDMTRDLLRPTGCWMAMKGKPPAEEILALGDRPLRVFHVEQLVVAGLDAERCLVWLK